MSQHFQWNGLARGLSYGLLCSGSGWFGPSRTRQAAQRAPDMIIVLGGGTAGKWLPPTGSQIHPPSLTSVIISPLLNPSPVSTGLLHKEAESIGASYH